MRHTEQLAIQVPFSRDNPVQQSDGPEFELPRPLLSILAIEFSKPISLGSVDVIGKVNLGQIIGHVDPFLLDRLGLAVEHVTQTVMSVANEFQKQDYCEICNEAAISLAADKAFDAAYGLLDFAFTDEQDWDKRTVYASNMILAVYKWLCSGKDSARKQALAQLLLNQTPLIGAVNWVRNYRSRVINKSLIDDLGRTEDQGFKLLTVLQQQV